MPVVFHAPIGLTLEPLADVGTLDIGTHRGQAAVTLGALTVGAMGHVLVQGAGAATLGTLASSATGGVLVQGNATSTLRGLVPNLSTFDARLVITQTVAIGTLQGGAGAIVRTL